MTTPITAERWQRAQTLERAYWCPANDAQRNARRREERDRHAFYAGLLGLAAHQTRDRSVLDLGCGPAGLLHDWPVREAYAVDPMRYDGASEGAYTAWGITRVYEPAETYQGPAVDEVWAYNLLQHVVDPAACVATAERHALRVVRWFEWTDTPVTDVHPHSITADWLRSRFGAAWRCTSDVRGIATSPKWSQRFVALVLERRG